jgi:hypothetical protein
MKENEKLIDKLGLLELNESKLYVEFSNYLFFIIVGLIMSHSSLDIKILVVVCPRSWSNGATMECNPRIL